MGAGITAIVAFLVAVTGLVFLMTFFMVDSIVFYSLGEYNMEAMNQTLKTYQIKGAGRGKLLGFPTINLFIPPTVSIPYGIYAAWIEIGKNRFMGALHYGSIPTFDSPAPSLEVFLIDANERLIPAFPIPAIQVELVKFLREVVKFDDSKRLIDQIGKDVIDVRKWLGYSALIDGNNRGDS